MSSSPSAFLGSPIKLGLGTSRCWRWFSAATFLMGLHSWADRSLGSLTLAYTTLSNVWAWQTSLGREIQTWDAIMLKALYQVTTHLVSDSGGTWRRPLPGGRKGQAETYRIRRSMSSLSPVHVCISLFLISVAFFLSSAAEATRKQEMEMLSN